MNYPRAHHHLHQWDGDQIAVFGKCFLMHHQYFNFKWISPHPTTPGGHLSNGSCALPIEVYDFSTGNWTHSGYILPNGRSKFCSFVDEHDIYLAGGEE